MFQGDILKTRIQVHLADAWSTGRYEIFDHREPGNLRGCHCFTDEVEVGQEQRK